MANPTMHEWFETVADDAQMLARLHAAELDAATWRALRSNAFPDCLGLIPQREEPKAAWQAMRDALAMLPEAWEPRLSESLACDFAAIYLNNRFRANPHASAWLDEDGLLFQNAMFDLRRIYAEMGVHARNWRTISEDHLAAQLQFTEMLARNASTLPSEHYQNLWQRWGEALEVYLLSWLKRFVQQVSTHAESPFYPALALLTWGWCETLRDAIAVHFSAPRLSTEVLKQRLEKVAKSNPGVGCAA